MADISLTLLVLKTRQVEQLRIFYQTLGIDLTEEQHGKGPVHFAGRVGDVVIEVYPLPDDGTPVDSSSRLGFAVVNVAKVVQALEGFGAKVVTAAQETAWGLRAVRRGLTAEARVVKAGTTLGYVECEVTDQAGKMVAKAASTCIKLK